MKILIADGHRMICDAISAYLKSNGPYQVVSATDFSEVLQHLKESGAFDLMLIDYNLPDMDGIDGIAMAMVGNGGNGVAVLAESWDSNLQNEALEAGAIGFLPKTLGADSLLVAVVSMISGERFIPIEAVAGDIHADSCGC